MDFSFFIDPNARWVMLGVMALGISAAIVGTFAFLRKRALTGDAVSHAVLPGVALSFLLVGERNTPALLLGAMVAGALALWCIEYLTQHPKIKPDTAIAIVLSGFYGVGIFLLTLIQQQGNAQQSGLDKFLFGKAAAIVRDDVWWLGGFACFSIGLIVIFYRPLFVLTFDADYAHTRGYAVRLWQYLLAMLMILAVSLGIQTVGVVLMAALLITPAAAARCWTSVLPTLLVLAGCFGAMAGLLGAYISYTLPQMPTGPWIVLCLAAVMGVSLALGRAYR